MMTNKIRNLSTRIATAILTASFALAAPAAIPCEIANLATVYAAESTIVTMGNGTTATSLTTGEQAQATLSNNVLTVKVGNVTKKFTIAGMETIVSSVKIAADDLLHIFLTSGKYYVWDLRGGVCVQYDAYRSVSGQYCLENNTAKKVNGSTADPMISGTGYFWEYISGNSQSRELLVTRAEFEALMYPTPTPTPNPNPTPNPTPEQTVTKFTVSFKDWDGTILKTEEVEKGHNAMPPASPTREGYVFRGWNGDYTNVQGPITVTAVYDKAPENSSTTTTNGTADTKVKFDFDFWWTKYTTGQITWKEFLDAAAQFGWTSSSTTDNVSKTITYYFYENGVLVRTESITTGQSTTNESGQGSATAQAQSNGSADVKVQDNGQGGGSGTAEAHTEIHTTSNTTNNNNSSVTKTAKTKTLWFEYHNNKKTYLRKVKNNVITTVSTVKYDRKKGVVRWNNKTYKDVKDIGFTSTSRQIVLLKKDGTAYILARAKGKDGNIYTDRKLSGKWKKIAKTANSKLAIRLTNKGKSKGVKNLQPKVKADKKALANSK